MQTSQQLNKPKFFSRASTRQRAIAGIILLAITSMFFLLWIIARYQINLSWWLGPCGFKQQYGLPCPTCGMTTSVLTFAEGKIFEAFYIQPAAALFCCILLFTALLALLVAVFGIYSPVLEKSLAEIKLRYVIIILIIIIAAGWAVTMARALAAPY
jgi:hypothetical protein